MERMRAQCESAGGFRRIGGVRIGRRGGCPWVTGECADRRAAKRMREMARGCVCARFRPCPRRTFLRAAVRPCLRLLSMSASASPDSNQDAARAGGPSSRMPAGRRQPLPINRHMRLSTSMAIYRAKRPSPGAGCTATQHSVRGPGPHAFNYNKRDGLLLRSYSEKGPNPNPRAAAIRVPWTGVAHAARMCVTRLGFVVACSDWARG